MYTELIGNLNFQILTKLKDKRCITNLKTIFNLFSNESPEYRSNHETFQYVLNSSLLLNPIDIINSSVGSGT